MLDWQHTLVMFLDATLPISTACKVALDLHYFSDGHTMVIHDLHWESRKGMLLYRLIRPLQISCNRLKMGIFIYTEPGFYSTSV